MGEWGEEWSRYYICYLGTVNYYNGDIYDGGMVGGKREGNQSSYEWAGGDRVRGEFHNDMPVSGKILIKGEG